MQYNQFDCVCQLTTCRNCANNKQPLRGVMFHPQKIPRVCIVARSGESSFASFLSRKEARKEARKEEHLLRRKR
jgi:hypothetical protein